jgi:hypothetical protein
MTQPGPAQLDLIRRYHRTLRQLQGEARSVQSPRRFTRAGSTEIGAAAAPVVADSISRGRPAPAA